MLLALQPMSLLDVGFQLSFLSVAGILLFRPCVDFLRPRNRLLAAMVSLACVAVAAQAATAPLVARYFHLFPVGFLLTNLVVVPCTYLLLGGALLHFSFSFIPVLQGITGNVLSVVAGFLCQSLELFAGWKWFSVAVHPSWLTVVLCYLLMGALLYAFFCRSRRAVVVSFVTAVLLWVNAFFMDGRVARQVIFFRSPASPSVLFVQDGGKTALWNAKGQLAAPVNRFLGEKGLPSPQMMGNLSESKGIVEFGPWRVVIFDAAHWQNIVTRRPLAVDVLYLSRSSLGGLTHWSELFQPKLVVVDASVRRNARQHLLEEIKTKGWPCHDMAVQGAYILR